MSRQLRQALERVARRFRHERLWSSLALCWLAWALVGWGIADCSASGRDVAGFQAAGCWRRSRSQCWRRRACAWSGRCDRRAIRAGWPGASRPSIPS